MTTRSNVATVAPAVARPRSAAVAPSELVAILIDAVERVLPLERDGVPTPGDDELAWRALAPLIGHYAVADAALALAMLYCRGSSEDEREGDVTYLVRSILEAFVAEGRMSSGKCAKARATIAGTFLSDEWLGPSEFAIAGMHAQARHDLNDVLSGGDFCGDSFGGQGNGELPGWFRNHQRRHERWVSG